MQKLLIRLLSNACCCRTPRAELQQEVQAAEERSTGPDAALHASSVAELEAACRESRSRINSLENEARYALAFVFLFCSITVATAGLC